MGLFIRIREKLFQGYIQKSFLVIGDYKKIWNRAKIFFLCTLSIAPLPPPNPVTSWCRRMYFTFENCDKTKVLPVVAVPITNDVSNKDLAVTEIIKIVIPNSLGRESTEAFARTDYSSKEGWVTVTTKKGRQSTPPGRFDLATGRLCHGM